MAQFIPQSCSSAVHNFLCLFYSYDILFSPVLYFFQDTLK